MRDLDLDSDQLETSLGIGECGFVRRGGVARSFDMAGFQVEAFGGADYACRLVSPTLLCIVDSTSVITSCAGITNISAVHAKPTIPRRATGGKGSPASYSHLV